LAIRATVSFHLYQRIRPIGCVSCEWWFVTGCMLISIDLYLSPSTENQTSEQCWWLAWNRRFWSD